MSPSLPFLNHPLFSFVPNYPELAWNRLANNHTCELKEKEIITNSDKRDGIKLMLQEELSMVFRHLPGDLVT